MALKYPMTNYFEKPFALDGVGAVADFIEQRGLAVYEDYRTDVLWPSQGIVEDAYYAAGRVMLYPDETERIVFAVGATAAIDSLRYSSAYDDEIAARGLRGLIAEPDLFAPIDDATHPKEGERVVTELYAIEAAHHPELTDLVGSIETGFSPTFDVLTPWAPEDVRWQPSIVNRAARLGVGYGAAMAHNAWEVALVDYAALPDEPST
ncbi:MAG: hypothetical protein KIH63_002735 [Candidatus Saccharibacteria bacterium]|nr:hypothetical protein [Candidatus Saccharibacteria bacterium]